MTSVFRHLWLILVITWAPAGNANITVVSWNLKHLGHAKQDRDFIAYLLTAQDLVLLQEVNQKTSGTQAVEDLAEKIEKQTGKKICYGFSDPPTDEIYERYAMLWVEEKLAYVTTEGEIIDRCPEFSITLPLVDQQLDKIVREPAYAVFLEKESRRKFLAATVHLVPTSKNPRKEIEPTFAALESALGAIAVRAGKIPSIVGGDFNLDVADKAFDVARTLGYRSVLKEGTLTSLKKTVTNYSKPYDNFFVRGMLYRNPEVAPIYKMYAKYRNIPLEDVTEYQIKKIYDTVSDHAPIRAQFKFRD